MAFKAGQRFDSDLARAQNERNWFMHLNEEAIPPAAAQLSTAQIRFLATLLRRLEGVKWTVNAAREIDLEEATMLQELFHGARRAEGLSMRDALMAVYDCFIDNPFTMQIGLFLVRMEPAFMVGRLNDVLRSRVVSA